MSRERQSSRFEQHPASHAIATFPGIKTTGATSNAAYVVSAQTESITDEMNPCMTVRASVSSGQLFPRRSHKISSFADLTTRTGFGYKGATAMAIRSEYTFQTLSTPQKKPRNFLAISTWCVKSETTALLTRLLVLRILTNMVSGLTSDVNLCPLDSIYTSTRDWTIP